MERNSNVSRFINVWIICKLVDHILTAPDVVWTDANTFVDKGFPLPYLNQFATDFKSLLIALKRGLFNEVNFFFFHTSSMFLSGILKRDICNSYKHVNTSSACCKRNLPILCSITLVNLWSHARTFLNIEHGWTETVILKVPSGNLTSDCFTRPAWSRHIQYFLNTKAP